MNTVFAMVLAACLYNGALLALVVALAMVTTPPPGEP